ncbi:DUF5131 family protein [Desulfovibrio litoralis]|uniref:Protein gp37 n=1 Tax=Desulfovibrio litoralis DSM 11393 TaxID=1121455 RepID=A0A1M7TN79_9BACT|nr:phage Gp37/Gp68 family protein [Desulfovibrio litoralis]SHN72165.1 protein gp37 [Desulfovibrio litoralis DSM 11393]
MSHSDQKLIFQAWNPVTGCSKFSSGCKNCYALPIALKLKQQGNIHYKNGFEISLHQDKLAKPLSWKKPKLIFVNSMSDLFHEKVPLDFIQQIFNIIEQSKQHIFIILTKRAERLFKLSTKLKWHENIALGVTVESKHYLYRLKLLQQIQAQTRFVFFEPLLSLIENIDFAGIHWALVGGESGQNARKMLPEWVTSIKNQCRQANVPFYFHQWGDKRTHDNLIDGKSHLEFPQSWLNILENSPKQIQLSLN